MTGHSITWAIVHQSLVGIPTCAEPVGAVCRLTGGNDCECDSWEMDHDKDGPFHSALAFDGTEDRVKHRMADSGQCQVLAWLTGSDALIELGPDGTVPLGTTPIRPVWTGDGYDWEPTEGGESS